MMQPSAASFDGIRARGQFALGVASALAGAALWGVSGVCAQYLFDDCGISPLFATVVRSAVATMAFFAVLVFGRRDLLRAMARSSRRTMFGFVAFGGALFLDQFAYATTVSYTNAGTATVLQMLGTVFVMLLTCVAARALPRAFEFAGLACALAAIVLIATQGDPSTLVLPAAGLFWGILNALSVAAYVIIPRRARLFDRFGSLGVTAVGILVTFVCSSCVYLVTRPEGFPAEAAMLDPLGWAVLVFGLALLGTFASFWLYLNGVSIAGSVAGSLLGATEPVSAMICAALVLGTAFSRFDWMGLALMLAMLALVTFGGQKSDD